MKDKIKECPFCGFTKPEYVIESDLTDNDEDCQFCICCNANKGGCGACGGYGLGKTEALENWENRTNEL